MCFFMRNLVLLNKPQLLITNKGCVAFQWKYLRNIFTIMNSSKKVTFGVPSNYEIKPFETDHFFSSIVDGLNIVRETLRINLKQLRAKCKDYVTAQLKDERLKTRLTALLNRRYKCNTIKDYAPFIEYTVEECASLDIHAPVLGQCDVEGQFICEIFNINIHVVESISENQWQHQLITKDGIKEVDSQKISYKDRNLIHIVKTDENVYKLVVECKKEVQTTNNASKKRGGTIDWGRLYEEGILAHVAMQCALNEQVEDFELFNNVDGLGAFDDVVLKIKYGCEKDPELYLFQVKHKENKHVNLSTVFERKNEIFYLPKYQESCNKIYKLYDSNSNLEIFANVKKGNIKFVLFSNIAAKSVTTHQYLFSKETSCDVINKFSTKEGAFPYKISSLQQNEVAEEFLSKCYIYLNQLDAKQIESLIGRNLNNNIHPDKVKLILNCFATWTRQKRNEKIVKVDMIGLIVKNCLPHYDIFTTEYVSIRNADVILRILNDDCFFPFIERLHLGILKQILLKKLEDYFNVKVCTNSWHANINHEIIKAKSEICEALSKRKMFSSHITHNDLFYLLWEIKKLPMLVEFTDKTTKCVQFIIEKFEKYLQTKSFVLVYQEKPSVKIGEKLNKIIDFSMLKDVSVSLQGKELVNLQTLINNEEKVLKTITPNVLLTLLVNTTKIEEKFDLVPYYIPRKITLPVLQESVFEETDHLFVLNDYGDVNIDEYQYGNNKFKNINVLRSHLSAENSLKLLNTIPKPKHFLIKEDGDFYLTKSSGSINDLRKHLLKKRFVKEENVLELAKSPINICSNTAGMGKTCLLQSISNAAAPEEWTIYLNLNKHVHKLDSFNYSETSDNIIDYLLKLQAKTDEEFLKELLLTRAKSGHLTLFLDGYDEVIFKRIKQFTEWATEMNIKILITTRPSKIVELEDALGIFSFAMNHFDREDQSEFLKQFYRERNLREDYIPKLIEKVEPYCNTFDGAFIGIPLQTKLLAEVLADVSENSLKTLTLDLIYLYEQFLNKKIVELGKHKRDAYKTFCKKLSLTLFFTEEILEEYIDFNDLNARIKEFIEENKKDFIISGFTNENIPMFVHRTYAEFLAAQYLYEQLTGKSKVKWETLQEKLFHTEMTDVRYFLDRIAARNCKLHKAVLSNNLELVKESLNEFNKEDGLGRTALELTCSYGKRFDLDTKDDVKGLINLEKHVEYDPVGKVNIPWLEQKFTINIEILKALPLFKITRNVSTYAIKTGSLEMLESLPTLFQLNQFSKHTIGLLLYYCTTHNFFNIITNAQSVTNDVLNIFYNGALLTHIAASKGNYEVCAALCKKGAKTRDIFGNKILHVAVQYEQLHFIEKMLDNIKEFNETIDGTMSKTPLHIAVQENYLTVVDLLLAEGANANFKTEKEEHVLHLACSRKFGINVKMVERLLQNDGIDFNSINDQDADGWTPLHYSVNRNNLTVTNLLLSKGANVHTKTKQGQHAIHLACSSQYGEDTEVLERLLQQYVNTEQEQHAIHLACSNGRIKFVERLLQHDANCLNYRDSNGWTPLHYSVNNNNLTVTNLLISKGANINARTKQEQLAIHLVCLNGKVEFVERLLQHDANSLNHQDCNGWTPLHYSVKNNNLTITNLLLSKGADINAKTKQGVHAIHLACLSEYGVDMNMVERLLQHNAIDVNSVNDQDDGWTPLHYSVDQNSLRFVNLLLANDANRQMKTKKGQHVLHLACSSSYTNIKIVQNLLQPDYINEQDEDGWTALHYGVDRNRLDVVNLLLCNKADANIKTRKSQLAMHLACSKNKIDVNMVECLIQHTNSINEQDTEGLTALHYAVARNDLKIVTMLLSNEADANITSTKKDEIDSINGGTSLHYAVNQNNFEIVNLLLSKGANVNVKNKWGQNVLYTTCLNHFTKLNIIERLLQCDEIDLNYQNNDGWTALHYAVNQNKFNVVDLLLTKGANTNLKTKTGNHVLHLACSTIYNNIKAVVERFLQKDGIDTSYINDKNENGWTALHYSIDHNKLDVADLLLANNADVRIKTRWGQHALHLACASSRTDVRMVERLLRQDGVDESYINDEDSNGRTALYFCINQNKLDVTELLLVNRANPNIK